MSEEFVCYVFRAGRINTRVGHPDSEANSVTGAIARAKQLFAADPTQRVSVGAPDGRVLWVSDIPNDSNK
jgi:hypothetical protein